MMNNIHFPDQLTGSELDEYLEKGWYRMGQVIFTTNYIVYEDLLYRVYWLRYHLPDVTLNRKHRQILKVNERFSVTLQPFQLSAEIETLYNHYKTGVVFDAPESVAHFLYDGGTGDVYDTMSFELRDGGKLIAVGIFDRGKESIAGIMNFYHPDYKKYSPGKFLMLLKLRYAQEQGKKWYYPGYVVAGNTRFDYKLFLGIDVASIFFPEDNCWMSYAGNWPGAIDLGIFNES